MTMIDTPIWMIELKLNPTKQKHGC